jgi:hypothetical protein
VLCIEDQGSVALEGQGLMNRPPEPAGSVNHPKVRMQTGIDVLETWTDNATQREKDTVYAALFAMTERSLLRTYKILDDSVELSEFFVLLPEDLVLKMRVHSFESFGIVYVGPRAGAPGLGTAV